jgi:hypothetical protein
VIIVVLRWYASNKLMFGAMPRKIPGVWGQSPQERPASFVHTFTKLNLTNVYATYAEPKQQDRVIKTRDSLSLRKLQTIALQDGRKKQRKNGAFCVHARWGVLIDGSEAAIVG